MPCSPVPATVQIVPGAHGGPRSGAPQATSASASSFERTPDDSAILSRVTRALLLLALLASGCMSADEANAAFAAHVEESNHCASDDECTVVYPGCPLGCWAAVNVEHAAACQAYAADLIASYERADASCAYDCIAAGPPYCDDEGRCRVDPEP